MVGLMVVGCGRTDIGARDGAPQELGPRAFDDMSDEDPEPLELCFESQVTFASGIDPCSIDTTDLDGDGHLDVAVPNSDFNHGQTDYNFASTLYGDGRGDLSSPDHLLAGGDTAFGIAIGTFDGDRRDDLVVANSNTEEINFTYAGESVPDYVAPFAMQVGAGPTAVGRGPGDVGRGFTSGLHNDCTSGGCAARGGGPSASPRPPSGAIPGVTAADPTNAPR